jgi:hypothetical protein
MREQRKLSSVIANYVQQEWSRLFLPIRERGGITMGMETILILMLITFILGLVVGVTLGRPHVFR